MKGKNLNLNNLKNDLFLNLKRDSEQRNIYFVYCFDYFRYLKISLLFKENSFYFGICSEKNLQNNLQNENEYNENDNEIWYDEIIFPSHVIEGFSKIFIIDGPILCVVFQNKIKFYPIDIDNPNVKYLEIQNPKLSISSSINCFKICNKYNCLIEWNNQINENVNFGSLIIDLTKLYQDLIDMIESSNSSTNPIIFHSPLSTSSTLVTLCDGLWFCLNSSSINLCTIPFLPSSPSSQLLPNSKISLSSLQHRQYSSNTIDKITSWKIYETNLSNENQNEDKFIESFYCSDFHSNFIFQEFLFQKSSESNIWDECFCLTKIETNLKEQLLLHNKYQMNDYSTCSLIVKNINVVKFGLTLPTNLTNFPSTIVLGVEFYSSNQVLENLLIILNGNNLKILSVIQSVGAYGFLSSESNNLCQYHQLALLSESYCIENNIESVYSSSPFIFHSGYVFENPSRNTLDSNSIKIVNITLSQTKTNGIQEIIGLEFKEGILHKSSIDILKNSQVFVVYNFFTPQEKDSSILSTKKRKRGKIKPTNENDFPQLNSRNIKPTSSSLSSFPSTTTLSHISFEKQSLMKTALLYRVTSSHKNVFHLIEQRQHKRNILISLKLTLKVLIEQFLKKGNFINKNQQSYSVLKSIFSKIKSSSSSSLSSSIQYTPLFSNIEDEQQQLQQLQQSNNNNIFSISSINTNTTNTSNNTNSKSSLNHSRQSNRGKSLRLSNTLQSSNPSVNSLESIEQNNSLKLNEKEQLPEINKTSNTSNFDTNLNLLSNFDSTFSDLEILGRFARIFSNNSKSNEKQVIIIIKLQNITKFPIFDISLNAELITSPYFHLSYLQNNSNNPSSFSFLSTSIKSSSAIIPILFPEHEATLSCIITINSNSNSKLSQSTSYLLNNTKNNGNQILERILQLNHKSITPSTLISLSDLIGVRVSYLTEKFQSTRVPLDFSNPLIIQEYNQIQYLNDKYSSRKFSKTCGILSIPPYCNNKFNSSKYHIECNKIFYPIKVFPIFFDELESERNILWENFHYIFLQNQQDSSLTFTHYSIFSNLQSFQCSMLQNSFSTNSKIQEVIQTLFKYFPSSITSASYLIKSKNISEVFPELLIRSSSLFEPIGLIIENNDKNNLNLEFESHQECLLHLYNLSESNYENTLITRLRYEMLSISCNLQYQSFTKNKLKKLLSLMESTLQIFMISLKCLAVAWREMNLFNARNQLNLNQNNQTLLYSNEVKYFVGMKLIVKNEKLLKDILYYQQLCDNAMLSLLIKFQEFL